MFYKVVVNGRDLGVVGHRDIENFHLSMSGDGKRMVFSTVLYGIVDDPGIPDWNTPHHIYLRDCP